MSGAGMPPVRLHIARLVLEGLALGPGGEARFQAALCEALGGLLRRQGLPARAAEMQGRAAPVVRAGSPEALGRAVAQQVHARLVTPEGARPAVPEAGR
jgi:hypothetical protein